MAPMKSTLDRAPEFRDLWCRRNSLPIHVSLCPVSQKLVKRLRLQNRCASAAHWLATHGKSVSFWRWLL